MQAKFDLQNKRVLVTGAASGIGLATAQTFLSNGARVALNDLPGEKLDSVVDEFKSRGFDVYRAAGSIGEAESAQTMVEQAIANLGGLDYLINNAGTPGTSTPIPPGDFERQDEAFWQLMLNVNLIGPYRCTRAAAEALRAAKGSIVNTASVSAYGGGASSSVYASTKAGLVLLTKEWARAFAPEVRVNAIAPGVVDSDWMCRFEHDSSSDESICPLQRKGSPLEYAEAILFLAAGADYVTGQTLIVDGGLTL